MSLHDPANRRADPEAADADQARLTRCLDCRELVDRCDIRPDRRCASCHERVFTRIVPQGKDAARPRPWWKRMRG